MKYYNITANGYTNDSYTFSGNDLVNDDKQPIADNINNKDIAENRAYRLREQSSKDELESIHVIEFDSNEELEPVVILSI